MFATSLGFSILLFKGPLCVFSIEITPSLNKYEELSIFRIHQYFLFVNIISPIVDPIILLLQRRVFLIVNLGEKLKALRKSNNMTQKDLADRIGVSKSIISSYESGTRYPSYDVLVKMAHFPCKHGLFVRIGKRRFWTSELTDAEIEAIKRLITIFIENRKEDNP